MIKMTAFLSPKRLLLPARGLIYPHLAQGWLQRVSPRGQASRFRTFQVSRTCRPLRDTLGALRWHKAGEARPHVRHETARLHHAARRRSGDMAARGARAAARAN